MFKKLVMLPRKILKSRTQKCDSQHFWGEIFLNYKDYEVQRSRTRTKCILLSLCSLCIMHNEKNTKEINTEAKVLNQLKICVDLHKL